MDGSSSTTRIRWGMAPPFRSYHVTIPSLAHDSEENVKPCWRHPEQIAAAAGTGWSLGSRSQWIFDATVGGETRRSTSRIFVDDLEIVLRIRWYAGEVSPSGRVFHGKIGRAHV